MGESFFWDRKSDGLDHGAITLDRKVDLALRCKAFVSRALLEPRRCQGLVV
jgi:hypothetical protein